MLAWTSPLPVPDEGWPRLCVCDHFCLQGPPGEVEDEEKGGRGLCCHPQRDPKSRRPRALPTHRLCPRFMPIQNFGLRELNSKHSGTG